MSDTTQEFSARLQQALDASPHAPAAQYGRLTWLQRELEERVGLKVSVNTVHKWAHGTSRPRPDNIRQIAQVLAVDEVWLALGRKPSPTAEPEKVVAGRATATVLIVAGVLEHEGARVVFGTSADPIPHLTVSLGATRFSLIVVEPQMTGVGKGTFIVPEPVGASRVLGALFRAGGAKGPTVSLDLFDLTGAPGQTFGGFSMIPFETVEGPGLRCVGGEIIRPLRDLSRLSEPAPVRGATAKNLS